MKVEQSICCNELMKLDVLDSSGRKIGKIGDLTFKFDGELKLSKFILAGPKWEELLESLSIRKDRDPVFDGAKIKRIGESVHLDTSVNQLKTTLDMDAIPKGDIRYSVLERMEIIDNHGKKVGHAIDIDFDVSGAVSMIVGGSFIEEKLEALGLKADVDIIVPGNVISSITDKIHLRVSKDELETTMVEAIKPESVKRTQEKRQVSQQVTKVRLFTQRPM
ncbi:MAG: PRC-barrel domain-containing protein [Candidatus Odinarchaeota archaeon]